MVDRPQAAPSRQHVLSLSVIIPVWNGAATLGEALRCLRASSRPPDEILVVDDGSTDDSAAIARSFGVTVLSTPGRCGPATARGIGAREASGEVLIFLDADVLVHPGDLETAGTIARLEQALDEDPSLHAVFGSYDTTPREPNFVSQWKNLSHHFVHQQGRPEAQTFWAGCGAIRRAAFMEVGGFDLRYRGATIEDIELGYRLRDAGFRIRLDPSILCTHAKRWTAWSAWKTDLLYRGIPWTRLILRTGVVPNDLNVSVSQRASLLMAWLMVGAFASAAVTLPAASLAGMLLFVLAQLQAWWTEPATLGRKGIRWGTPLLLAGGAFVVAVGYGLALFAVSVALGLLLAFFFRRRPANLRSRPEDAAYALYFAFTLLALVVDLPPEPEILVAAILALGLLGLNQSYYAFLARERGIAFVMAAVPFQLVYHLTNGISLLMGILLTLKESPAVLLRRRAATTTAAEK